MKKEVKSIKELGAVADEILRTAILGHLGGSATVVGLSGDLGAGKTAFTKCIANILGITDVVTSPTFILEKVYNIPNGSVVGSRFAKLVHIDAYRLHSASDMRALDWGVILADEKNLVLIEWPEQVKEAMPNDIINLSFEYVSDEVRRITLK